VHADPASAASSVDMIMFFKNLAMFGALLMYTSMKPAQRGRKIKRAVMAMGIALAPLVDGKISKRQ